MADFNALEALINANIKKNGVQAITGNILNGILRGMVSALGKGYTIAGSVTPSSDPGTMTGPVAYIAYTAGTYTHFNGLEVEQGEVAMLIYNEAEWHKEVLFSLAANATVDGNVGTPEVGVSFVDGLLTFNFRNLKGNPGENGLDGQDGRDGVDGQDGAAAGFGTVTASVDANVGTPGVTVQTSGPNTAKNFAFQFTNLKGETGVTSCVVTVDNTSGTPSCSVSLVGQVLHLDFTGLKGAQGDTGSSVDYPFTIVNNLTTNDATQALSAAMGVELAGQVSQLEAKVTDFDNVINGFSPTEYEFGNLVNAIISTSGVVNATSPRCGYYIPVNGGESVSIKGATNKRAYYCAVKSIVTTGGQNADLATGFTGVKSTTLGGSDSFTIPSDANYLYIGYIVTSDSSAIVSPAELVIAGWDVVNNRPVGEPSGGLVEDVAGLKTGKQDKLVSGTNIKTINGQNVLGAGNLVIKDTELQREVDEIHDGLYGVSPTEYQFGSLVNAIISSQGIINASSPRCGYYIPLLGGETIRGKAKSDARIFYCCVKSIVTTAGASADLATGWSGSLNTTYGGTMEITAPSDARYLYIGYIVSSDATATNDPAELVINDWDVVNQRYIGQTNPGLIDRVEELESREGFSGLLRLSVAEHNEGGYNYGESPSGLPQESFDTDVALWKSLLTKTNSDFLAVSEHSHILNQQESGVTDVDSYTELYKQFYPYKYDGASSHKYALFSKYPIKSTEKVDFSVTDRYFDKHLVDVNGVEVCIVVFKGYVGTPGSAGQTSRVAEFTELVSLLADHPIVIIHIDTNSQYTDDFDVFRNNGYQLGNFGYWGEKLTCGISETYPQGHYAFDNIIVKGMNINSFDVCDEHATSDHFPTMSKLSVFIAPSE